ncbi:class I SAM-dependent methyltransferase [Flavobacterium sp.]|uniref:class I SAM-dependent methyltransferase n=1 Tax=Flavobacterium sp. TaxID=239 RepID=UPI003753E647
MQHYISFGDFLDIYHKVREKSVAYFFKKFKILPKSRIESKWDAFESTSDFWLIPEIQQSWNLKISGNPEMIYEDYVFNKYLSDKKDLRMLSVGCGEGLHERNFAKHFCFSQIDAIDFSNQSVVNAQRLAIENNFKINYQSGDFKKIEFKNNSYDLILFSSSLHHFENVEDTLENYVKPLLSENGILVVFEYVGPNRLQWSKKQLDKANQLLEKLPKKYKLLINNSSKKRKVYKPGIIRMFLVDPSEAIDSEAIVPGLKSKFKILEQTNLGWNILHILLKGISHNFLNEEPETKTLIKNLLEEEDIFVKLESHSDAIFGVYQK